MNTIKKTIIVTLIAATAATSFAGSSFARGAGGGGGGAGGAGAGAGTGGADVSAPVVPVFSRDTPSSTFPGRLPKAPKESEGCGFFGKLGNQCDG